MALHDPLPLIMVAPNGARKTLDDHPALPVTIAQTVRTAKACFAAGAGGIHAHVRDTEQKHVLDAGLYRELIAELKIEVPHMMVQITTEAVGVYTPLEQRQLLYDLKPPAVSIGLSEISSDQNEGANRELFSALVEWDTSVQLILYDASEFQTLSNYIDKGLIDANNLKLLFVLGRYSDKQESQPHELDPFLEALKASHLHADWALCAFGQRETECLVKAYLSGGKMRIGFENNMINSDGSLAPHNAARVQELVSRIIKPVEV